MERLDLILKVCMGLSGTLRRLQRVEVHLTFTVSIQKRILENFDIHFWQEGRVNIYKTLQKALLRGANFYRKIILFLIIKKNKFLLGACNNLFCFLLS